MNRIKLTLNRLTLLALCGAACLPGCSKNSDRIKSLAELHPEAQSAKLQDAVMEEKAEPPRYFYPYASKRDPFAPLAGGPAGMGNSAAGKGLEKGELTNLELRGIMKDRKGKVAFISSTDGEPFVLRSGRIYDRKNRIISGVSGIIKENSVVLISSNRTMTELTLKKRDSGTAAGSKGQ